MEVIHLFLFFLSLSLSLRRSFINRCYPKRIGSQTISLHITFTAWNTEELDQFQSTMFDFTWRRTIQIERSRWCWYVPSYQSPGNGFSLRAFMKQKAHRQRNGTTTKNLTWKARWIQSKSRLHRQRTPTYPVIKVKTRMKRYCRIWFFVCSIQLFFVCCHLYIHSMYNIRLVQKNIFIINVRNSCAECRSLSQL